MNNFKDNVLRLVAVIGLLAVLLLGAWGIIQIAFVLPSFFNNMGGAISGLFRHAPAAEQLTISIPAGVVAGQPFVLNWSHTNKQGEHSYAVSYSCESGLSVVAPVPTGSYTQVPCDTPFNYINASSSMPLVAILGSGTKTAHPTLTVTATALQSGAVTATAHAATTVSPAKTTATAAKPSTTPVVSKPPTSASNQGGGTYYPSGRTNNLYGYPDLAVRITSASSQSGNVTVVFSVQNIGTNVVSANWTFTATLPINGSYVYPAGPQQLLYPGDKIVYTLRYSGGSYNNANQYYCGYPGYQPYNYGGYGNSYNYQYQYQQVSPPYPCVGYQGSGAIGGIQTVSVQVDPYNLVPEVSKINNYASATYYGY